MMDLVLEKYPESVSMMAFMFLSIEYQIMKTFFKSRDEHFLQNRYWDLGWLLHRHYPALKILKDVFFKS